MKTYEEDQSTKLLVAETVKYKILGEKKETDYFKEYHTTNDEARREYLKAAIIKSNLRFVLNLANDWHKATGLPVNEFYAEGKLGLVEAFNKYDYRQNVKFVSFAVWEIRRHMQMIVQNSDAVHIPVRMRKNILEAKKKGKPVDDITYGVLADNAIGDQVSIYQPAKADGEMNNGLCIGDVIPDNSNVDDGPEQTYERSLLNKQLTLNMSESLSPEENSLLRKLYGLDGYEESVADIADYSGKSKEYIRKLKNTALAKLRKNPSMQELGDELLE